MLKGSRVYLSPLQEKDLPTLFAWINNRESVSHSAPYRPISDFEHRTWYNSVSTRSDCVFFLIQRVGDDEAIGSCQLQSIHTVHRNAELRIRIGETANREQGFGTEALRLLLRFAFEDLNLERVYLHAFATNAVAIRVYEKVGFAREGVLRRAAYVSGSYVDVIVMGILRDEYARQ